jgi:hypothetical protein
VLSVQNKLFAVLRNSDRAVGCEVSSKLGLELVVSIVKELSDKGLVLLELFAEDLLFEGNHRAGDLDGVG